MKIKLEKVGIIKHAEIEFLGLTVIAGENDSGKSTVGRMIYSAITAFGQTEADIRKDKIEKIFNIVRKIAYDFNDNIEDTQKQISTYSQLFAANLDNTTDVVSIFDKFKQEYINRKSNENPFFNKDIVEKNFSDLERILKQTESLEKYIHDFLEKVLYSEFSEQINNSVHGGESRISCIEKDIELFSFNISKNKLLHASVNKNNMFLKKSTLIESPLSLQLKLVLDKAKTTLEIADEIKNNTLSPLWVPAVVPLHIKALLNTLSNVGYIQKIYKPKEISQKINNIIKGEFIFNKNDNDFIFRKTNSKDALKILNTANGVKAFGLIEILARINALNETSLLIIDEPEINMHPEWQLKYAELLIELCKSGVKILVTSHSPYMIQALKYFSQKAAVFGEKTRFYLAERVPNGENWAEIKDVGMDINPIFDKLTKPFDDLINDFE
ncbi:putative AAA family ATPase [Candidatus Termititenax persephonae]|uniref:AAA family ATPase n=1 Tax=Candidatus Termititenax persephonae TaxID=2218525 RepID=A0A388THX2_9BACT|nr:putative AAA family ATPase [Candidatus Termititenax persephonae]